MLFGVGIDIEDHLRFLKYKNSDSKLEYLLSIYSKNELKNYANYNSHLCFALSFSCKESLFKAFGVSWNNSKMQWTDIELLFSDIPENKKARVKFSGYATELIEKYHITYPPEFSYSISDTHIIFESILSCSKK